MRFTEEEIQEYRQALQDRVCAICKSLGYEDSCKVGKSGVCPVEAHLPRLLEAVLSTPRNSHVSAYLPKLREVVCAHCENQDSKGICEARNQAACGLDSFILLVVEAVEEVQDRQGRSRRRTAASG